MSARDGFSTTDTPAPGIAKQSKCSVCGYAVPGEVLEAVTTFAWVTLGTRLVFELHERGPL